MLSVQSSTLCCWTACLFVALGTPFQRAHTTLLCRGPQSTPVQGADLLLPKLPQASLLQEDWGVEVDADNG